MPASNIMSATLKIQGNNSVLPPGQCSENGKCQRGVMNKKSRTAPNASLSYKFPMPPASTKPMPTCATRFFASVHQPKIHRAAATAMMVNAMKTNRFCWPNPNTAP